MVGRSTGSLEGSMGPRRIFAVAVVIGAVHFLAAWVTAYFSDAQGAWGAVCVAVSNILLEPALSLWHPKFAHYPNWPARVAAIANSLAWGMSIALIIAAIKR